MTTERPSGDRALILTYHGVEAGPPPLWVDPGLFRAHLDCLQESGAQVLTVSELTERLLARTLPERAVAITFDDGMSSVVEHAAPLLVERAMSATIYCVAGRLGGDNAWPSQPSRTERRSLADARSLAELARLGFEIGSHGMQHMPLHAVSSEALRREIVDSKHTLEQLVGAQVSSFAYPYGALPAATGVELVRANYSAACGGRSDYVHLGVDPFALPRVDVHYLRRPPLLGRAATGSLRSYIAVRRTAGRVRRYAVKDYAAAANR